VIDPWDGNVHIRQRGKPGPRFEVAGARQLGIMSMDEFVSVRFTVLREQGVSTFSVYTSSPTWNDRA
jgi:hypothetical protein